ncbi:hypothetical protein F4778DRAFT_797347 [Xylariomycetidae sp. FL2044]|nr:hypothetical protein F4778DRAFT_797347 [Xylariomycetidae sp. FL2044]
METSTPDKPSIPAAHYVDNSHWYVGGHTLPAQYLPSPMTGASVSGLVATDSVATTVRLSCLNSNCTFPGTDGGSYSSMGFCSSCTGITDSIRGRFIASNQTVSGASGYAFELSDETSINLFDQGSWTDWIDIMAANCSLFPCLRNYEGAVVKRALQESLVSSTPTNVSNAGSDSHRAIFEDRPVIMSPCDVDGQSRPERTECHGAARMRLFHAVGPEHGHRGLPVHVAHGVCPYAWLSNMGNLDPSTITCDWDGGKLAPGRPTTTVCTHVNWGWVALPNAWTALTLVLLVAAVTKSSLDRGVRPVWNSSVFPLLFHGLMYEADDKQTLVDVGHMSQAARQMDVMLGKARLDLSLVGGADGHSKQRSGGWVG